MAEIDKYLKIAKKVVIKPEDHGIEEKIIERISKVDENDTSLLDSNFMDYLKKNNSRLYLFSEGVKNNPGKFILIVVSISVFLGLLAFIIKKSSDGPDKNRSRSNCEANKNNTVPAGKNHQKSSSTEDKD